MMDEKFETPENVTADLKTYAAYGVTAVQVLGTDKDFGAGYAYAVMLQGAELAGADLRRAVLAWRAVAVMTSRVSQA